MGGGEYFSSPLGLPSAAVTVGRCSLRILLKVLSWSLLPQQQGNTHFLSSAYLVLCGGRERARLPRHPRKHLSTGEACRPGQLGGQLLKFE